MGVKTVKHWTTERIDKAIKIILARISDGESVRQILSTDRDKEILPSRPVFGEWLANNKGYATRYARACEDRAELIFEEILEIADDDNADLSMGEDGAPRVDGQAVQRSKLRVDARKWILSKMQPAKYGDKLDVTTDGEQLKAPIITIKNVE